MNVTKCSKLKHRSTTLVKERCDVITSVIFHISKIELIYESYDIP